MKIGSLCTGYGGLDLAVESYFGAETIWCAEFDKYANQVIEKRFNIPNYGDIKKIDWALLPSIDILTAGYPCQPFSNAGYRKGTDDPRHIWPYIKEAISILRPRIVVMENVRGHITLGFKEVLAGLTEIGYDAKWELVRASDVGAPHRRERLFIIATPTYTDDIGSQLRKYAEERNQRQSQFESCECGKVITYSDSISRSESRRTNRSVHGTSETLIDRSDRDVDWGSSAITSDTDGKGLQGSWNTSGNASNGIISDANDEYQPHNRQMPKLGRRFATRREMQLRRSPDPLDLGKLNPKFVEYMMGLYEGWVTDCGLSRSQQLKMLGNGVVPQQAEYAIHMICTGGDNEL